MPKENIEIKSRLHPRNKNRERYNLEALVKVVPELKEYITINKYRENSVEFSNPIAVKLLNKALLKHYYRVEYWDFPDDNLCPPIPGRADYLHYVADLLAKTNDDIIPLGEKIKCLDIGTGASLIYPIIGVTEYGWQFIASDSNQKAIESANKIIEQNTILKDVVVCKLQADNQKILDGILSLEEKIDVSMCNPPFHASIQNVTKGTQRKIKNLSGKNTEQPERNFSGVHEELIYDGGEFGFIKNYIKESVDFSKNCLWFTTLVSKQSNLKGIQRAIEQTEAKYIKKIPMGTGNKSSRIIAWSFLSKEEQYKWSESRWKVK